MTMQVGMFGSDGIVLASDKCVADMAGIRKSHTASKIRLDINRGIAIGCARNLEWSRRIADKILAFGDKEWESPIPAIQKVGEDVIELASGERADAQCLVVATKPALRMFFLHANNSNPLARNVICEEIEDRIEAGDANNAAVFWTQKYYKKELPVERLSVLAAHLILSAGAMSKVIDGLEIIQCFAGGGMSRLTESQLDDLKLRVRQWDDATEESIAIHGIIVDKDKFDALLGKMLATPPLPKNSIPKKRKPRKPAA